LTGWAVRKFGARDPVIDEDRGLIDPPALRGRVLVRVLDLTRTDF
jgi:hypothetical protein